jgi:hypothetical protein
MEAFAGIKSFSPQVTGKSCPEWLQKLPGSIPPRNKTEDEHGGGQDGKNFITQLFASAGTV